MAGLAGAGIHVGHGTDGHWATLPAVLALMAATCCGTRVWTLTRQAAAEDRARAEEEAEWWSGPLDAYDGGDGDTVAFGQTVVPIATRRSRPVSGVQKAG